MKNEGKLNDEKFDDFQRISRKTSDDDLCVREILNNIILMT